MGSCLATAPGRTAAEEPSCTIAEVGVGVGVRVGVRVGVEVDTAAAAAAALRAATCLRASSSAAARSGDRMASRSLCQGDGTEQETQAQEGGLQGGCTSPS